MKLRPVVPSKDTKPKKTKTKVDTPHDVNSSANVGATSPTAPDATPQQVSESKPDKSKKKPPLAGGPAWSVAHPTTSLSSPTQSSPTHVAQTNKTAPGAPAPHFVLPPLPVIPQVVSSAPAIPPAPLPIQTTTDGKQNDAKKKAARATSPNGNAKSPKGKAKKASNEVPDELCNGVIKHVRNPLVSLLARNCANAFPAFKLNSIPPIYLTKDTDECKAMYAHCTKQYCVAELLCVMEADQLEKHHDDYKKFMVGFHNIWIKRIYSANGDNGFDTMEKPGPEDIPVNIGAPDAQAIELLIKKYWNNDKSKPKKLSDVV